MATAGDDVSDVNDKTCDVTLTEQSDNVEHGEQTVETLGEDTFLDDQVEIDQTKVKTVRESGRGRTLTDKGKVERLRGLKNRQTAALSAITKKRNELSRLMLNSGSDNLHLVKFCLGEFVDLCRQYHTSFASYYEQLDSEAVRDHESKRYEEKEISILSFRKEVESWISGEALLIDKSDLLSNKNSQASNRTTSSTRSALAKEKARLAELMAEKDMLEETRKMKELQLNIEIAKTKAREKVYTDMDSELQGNFKANITSQGAGKVNQEVKDDTPKREYNYQGLNPQASYFTPSIQVYPPLNTTAMDPSIQQTPQPTQNNVLHTNRQMASAMFLPQPEVPKFKGDPTAFSSFMMAFDARIVPHTTNSTDRLYYLDQQLEGEPKELIAGCLYMLPGEGYIKARELLAEEYGNPYKVSTAYVNQVLSWPDIRQEDSQKLKQFSFFLAKCSHAMNNMSHMTVLNHAPNMQAIVLKLPLYLQNKWRDHITRSRIQGNRMVGFKDLVEFIDFASKSANEPIFSKEAMSKTEGYRGYTQNRGIKRDRPVSSKSRSSTFATSLSQNYTDQKKKVSCHFCWKSHDIDDCEAFKQKALNDKRSYLRDKNMCYGCYGYNHTVKGCLRKRTCRKCGKRHPTALHDDNFQMRYSSRYSADSKYQPEGNGNQNTITETVSSSCNSTNSDSVDTVLQSILPVIVRQQGNSKAVKTYALLDNGSTGCFITETLKNQLGVLASATTLKLQTMHGVDMVQTSAVNSLIVTDNQDNHPLNLPRTFVKEIPVNHNQIPDPKFLEQFPDLEDMASKLPEFYPQLEVGLLIGSNCPAALQPQKVIPSGGEGPFAVLYKHGWTINGPLHVKYSSERNSLVCNRVILSERNTVKEYLAPSTIVKIFERDFSEQDVGKVPGEKGYSREDQKFMETVEKHVKFVNGHFELPLPFRDKNSSCISNRSQAESRVKWQKKKMLHNEQYYKDYVAFIDNLFEKGFAYKIPEEQLSAESKNIWYLPHHGIYHPKKPTKIRVVFDCSAKYEGSSLNDKLLQGPDLTNSLIGVLTRFRAERIAFMADIESMFYQVKVPVPQHDSLRFLWWPNGDVNAELQEYRMGVHIFGAVSSPSISNFALKETANRAEEKFDSDVAYTIRKNFYVDDCLKSVKDEETAKKLIYDVRAACADGGFKLTKFTSNSRNVLKSIPVDDQSKEVQTRDLDYDELPIERALGMRWYVNTDMFGFSTDFIEKPVTRRGLLSTVSSLYDPLGIVAPIILPAKRILQELCTEKALDWDDSIPEKYVLPWDKWLNELKLLETLKIERCLKPAEFGDIKSRQIHVFSDASSVGYGCVAYLRLCDVEQNVHVAFLMGKSRLTPVKPVSIPRLELTAATVSVQIAQLMLKELDTDVDSVTYFTDSTTVLHYINNEKKRYPVFVANRVRLIRDFSEPSDWKYIESEENPADVASRGASTSQLLGQPEWFEGPKFLRKSESEWNLKGCGGTEPLEEETVATTSVSSVNVENEGFNALIKHYSNWYRLKRAVVVYLQLKNILQAQKRQGKGKVEPLVCDSKSFFTIEKLEHAENIILKFVQSRCFSEELTLLAAGERGRVPKRSSVYKLDPFIEDGVLKVGGRLSKAQIPEEMKHQILLPSKHHVTRLIIRDIHQKLGHVGRNHVLANLREKYWVIRANANVRNILSSCVTCRRLKTPPTEQKMADLPFSRVNPAPPFAYTGVDFFGPHIIKEGRKQMKRYGALFTCLVSRAVHIETANSLDTDSFIHALRRFIARRGPVKEIWCDNGTNFIGAARELKESLAEIDHDDIHSHMLQANIDWKFNPPSASHMGGVWERMIGSVRKVLSPMLYEFGERLDDEAYRTLLCEVEAIINSRPLTTVSSDTTDLNPLTPNHLLMMKSNVVVAPQGKFQRDDVYMRRRWRRIQYLANVFWTRWRKEYLYSLQERQKWSTPKRNMQVDDIVLIKDENSHRSCWPMGRVIKVESDKRGFVRSVILKTQSTELRRPVHKLVLLLPKDE